jgi:hypothetical protein
MKGGGGGIGAPFALNHIVATGQSLSVGYGSIDAGIPAQPFSNVKLFDSSGTYDTTAPLAPTLSRVPLTTPQRPPNVPVPTANYPANIGINSGSTPEVAMADMATQLLGWTFLASCTGIGAAGLVLPDVIGKGGSGNAYAAGIYEATAFAERLALPYGSFGAVCVLLTHGETDSTNLAINGFTAPSTYGTPLATLQADYEADLRAATGQRTPAWLQHIPIVLTLPQSSPPPLNGRQLVTQAMIQACALSPDLFVNAGPKYQYPPNLGFGPYHLADYRPLGEKCGQALARYVIEHASALEQGRSLNPAAWAPLQQTGVGIVGLVVTVSLNVPVLPLVFDTVTVTQPHASMFNYWFPGLGFEAWDGQVAVTGVSATTPLVVTTSPAHGRTSGDPVVIDGVLTTTASTGTSTGANVACFAQVLTPTTVALFSDAGLTTPIGPPSSGAAPYASGGLLIHPIAITAATIVGSTVHLALATAPAGGQLFVGYAQHTDELWNPFNGAVPPYRGNLRDSDPLFDISLIKASLYSADVREMWCNWLCPFLVGPM